MNKRERREAEYRLEQLKLLRGRQQRLKRLKAAQEYRRKHWSIRYYNPHLKQQDFHGDSNRIRLILGGNRSGKTKSSTNESVSLALGYRPWLPEDHMKRNIDIRVPNKGLIVGESFGEQIKKVLVPNLIGDSERGLPGSIPTELLDYKKKNQQGIVTYIRLKNGSSIDLQSYDQDVSLFESTDYDWAYFDEPPPRPVWIAVQRGLTDRRGKCWFAMTPLKEPWIYDELFTRDDISTFVFDIQDNVGFGLTQEAVDEFSLSLTEEEKEARLRGRFFHLSGLVYKLYGSINRIRRQPIQRHWGVWMHIDSHPRTPHHAVWVAVLPDGKKFVCGELANSNPSNLVAPFAEAIKVYESEILGRPGDEVVRLIEPGSSIPNPTKNGASIRDEFESNGIYCRPGSKNRDAGILLMQNELQYSPEDGTYPNIFFFDDLEGIHREMTHYVWQDWNAKVASGRTEKQVPKDMNDHFIEGLHRILLDRPDEYYSFGSGGEEEEVETRAVCNSITGY